MGTGWILDYAIPEGQDKYPTTWYIATNSHVIGSFRFPRNHYDTVLPRDDEQTRKLKSSNIRRDYSNLSLGGGLPCRLVDQVGYLDMSLAHAETAQKNQDNYGFVYRKKMYEPRLFWTAINYLEKSAESGVDYDHFSDFSVLELEFTSEQAAREATRNFADKYKVGTKGGINLFDKPLEAKYSKSELYDMNDNFYLLAYAGGAKDRWSYTTNLNEETGIASQLAGNSWDWMYVDQEKKRYRGFVEAKQVFKQGFGWGGKTYKEVGHFYKLKYNPLRPGSSGGVFVDKNGSAIGLTGAVEIGPKAVSSWVTPLRSEGVTVEESGVKTPKYDLIVGVEGQKSSYRQQVEKFNKKTWLSSKGWKN
ncbi:hypothetical protein OVS_03570 [Mycoplasma ovis str. Michigan]|uniref:DUF31 domain-containing protein n=1 Tax=Mycoplasma ovis str. Michigan TaxID=1415773 RepID=A0ABN4BSE3_9MOLU|nr:hypothetical protein [Mycoplasma ovis]AHC40463.1 hypothetical protein OVS_03570 [Mycoplasma ovis str. Michigan]